MKILITGGAGYIGSHTAKQLLETTNYRITILDNLSTSSIKTINTLKSIREFDFLNLDLKKFDKVKEVLEQNRFDVIIHFAAYSIVSESMQDPFKYYLNNTANTTNLIKCSVETGVKKFIFHCALLLWDISVLSMGVVSQDTFHQEYLQIQDRKYYVEYVLYIKPVQLFCVPIRYILSCLSQKPRKNGHRQQTYS